MSLMTRYFTCRSISNPLEQPLDDFGSRPRGIDSHVRVGVCDAGAAGRAVPSASRSAASGRRPSRGIRSMTQLSGISSHATAPSASMRARLSGSTNVPPPAATTTFRAGSSSRSTCAPRCGSMPRPRSRKSRPPSGVRALRSVCRCPRSASRCGGRARPRWSTCPRP